MAALTQSGVVINDAFKQGGTSGRKFKVLDVTLTLSSQGGLTNNIPASLFGLRRIIQAYGFRTTASVRAEFGPNLNSATPPLNGTLLVAYDNTNATDANRDNPADLTGTFRGFIEGYE